MRVFLAVSTLLSELEGKRIACPKLSETEDSALRGRVGKRKDTVFGLRKGERKKRVPYARCHNTQLGNRIGSNPITYTWLRTSQRPRMNAM